MHTSNIVKIKIHHVAVPQQGGKCWTLCNTLIGLLGDLRSFHWGSRCVSPSPFKASAGHEPPHQSPYGHPWHLEKEAWWRWTSLFLSSCSVMNSDCTVWWWFAYTYQGVEGTFRVTLLSVFLQLPVVVFNPLTSSSSLSFFSSNHELAQRGLIDTAAAAFLSRQTSNQQPARTIIAFSKKLLPGISWYLLRILFHRLPVSLVVSLYLITIIDLFFINLPNSFMPYSTFNFLPLTLAI